MGSKIKYLNMAMTMFSTFIAKILHADRGIVTVDLKHSEIFV